MRTTSAAAGDERNPTSRMAAKSRGMIVSSSRRSITQDAGGGRTINPCYNLGHTMRYVIASVIVAVLGAACEGNPSAPSAPPPSAPEAPPPPLPLPAAPRAVLSVGRGDVN